MRILGFIDKYCQDLLEDNKRERKLFDFSEFPNDGTVTDSEGNIIPIVVINGVDVPVSDFLSLVKPEFLKAYPLQEAEEIYDRYISALEFFEGEEAVSRIRNAMQAERERLQQDVALITEV